MRYIILLYKTACEMYFSSFLIMRIFQFYYLNEDLKVKKKMLILCGILIVITSQKSF